MALTQTEVSELYTSIFNRASEGSGNTFWQASADATTAANDMLATPDAVAYFGTSLDTNQAFVEHIYLNTLSKTTTDDAAGINYWVARLDAGESRGLVVASLVDAIAAYGPTGATPATSAADIAAYNQFVNRVSVSNYMADTVQAAPSDYATSTAFTATGIEVTDSPATVISGKAAVDAFPNPGQDLTLTTLQDIINNTTTPGSTTGADIFRGVAGAAIGQQDQTTLNSSDILDGGNGADIMAVLLNGNYGGGATIKNIETLQIGSNQQAAVAFDYNVNAGLYEVSGVNKIIYDQITTGETLNVNNVTPSAADGAAPMLSWENENGSAAGTMGVTYRQASISGTADSQTIGLRNINGMTAGNGIVNVAAGVETFVIESSGDIANNTLNNSANVDAGAGSNGAAADLVSSGSLTKVIVQGATAAGKIGSVVATTGLVDRTVGADTGSGAATQSNLLSAGSRVTEVDASEMTGAANVRFVAKTNGSGTNVTFKGGSAGDYAEFELGSINAAGNAGDDAFAFVTQAAGITNSTFGSTDSIVGGAGTDTIQIGINGVGAYTLNTSEFSNKTGVDVLDLRGQTNDVTVSSAFVAAADSGTKFTIRTDKLVQTSDTSSANPAGLGGVEDSSTHVVNLTALTQDQGIIVTGGSGSDRVVTDNASFNQNVEIDLSTNGAVAGRYDTITVLDTAVIDSGDVANIKGTEGMILAETVVGASIFNITMTEAFILNNTASANAVGTSINDMTYRIGSAASSTGIALGAGDTVTIDISDMLNATRTGVKTSLTGRGVDVALGAATVNYVVDGAAATAAQIGFVTVADANRADVTTNSAAGVVIVVPTVVNLAAGGTFVGVLGTNENFTGDIASTVGTTVTGNAADTEALTITDAGAVVIPATFTLLDSITLANGTNTLTGAVATGATTINGGTGTDTMVLAAADNISAITLNSVDVLQLTGASSMTLAQHEAAIIAAPTAADSVAVIGVGGTFTEAVGVETYTAAAATSAVNVTLGATNTGTTTGSAFADTFNTTVANLNLMTGGIVGGVLADNLVITGGMTAAMTTAAGGLTAGGSILTTETITLSGAATANVLTITNGATSLVNVNTAGVTGATGAVVNLIDVIGLTTATGATSITLSAGNDRLVNGVTGVGNNNLAINFGTGNAVVDDIVAGGTGTLLLQIAESAAATTTLSFTANTAVINDFGISTLDFTADVQAFKLVGGANTAGQVIFFSDAAMATQIAAGAATAVRSMLFDVDGDGAHGVGDIAIIGAAAAFFDASQAYSIVGGNVVIA
jgi:hypothetical protein